LGNRLNLGASHELIITSVFANIPQNSTLTFDLLLRLNCLQRKSVDATLEKRGTRTTVLLKSSASVETANRKLVDLIKNNCRDCSTAPFLFPYVKSRLYNEFENGKERRRKDTADLPFRGSGYTNSGNGLYQFHQSFGPPGQPAEVAK